MDHVIAVSQYDLYMSHGVTFIHFIHFIHLLPLWKQMSLTWKHKNLDSYVDYVVTSIVGKTDCIWSYWSLGMKCMKHIQFWSVLIGQWKDSIESIAKGYHIITCVALCCTVPPSNVFQHIEHVEYKYNSISVLKKYSLNRLKCLNISKYI